MERKAAVSRDTRETQIRVRLDLDGAGSFGISTGVGFFNHMLSAFALHGGFDLHVDVKGDLDVDAHHTVEDTGIALGQAFSRALGDKTGIRRYGSFYVPMDEALAFCSVDISNRPFLVYHASFHNFESGGFDYSLLKEFFRAFAFNAGLTLHLHALYGENDHHKAEAMFKAAAHAMGIACATKPGTLSTKGVL